MAEPALTLRDHPQIIDLISVLEQSGLQKQKYRPWWAISTVWKKSCPR